MGLNYSDRCIMPSLLMLLFAYAKSHFTSRDDGHISRFLVTLVHAHPSSSVRQ